MANDRRPAPSSDKSAAAKKPRPRSLGPIADLERHLPADWWRTLFNSLYLKTDGDVVENDVNTVKEIDWVLSSTRFEQNDRILDLCCGQGRHSLELARRGYTHVLGLDRSRYLVRLAKRRAKDTHLQVSFHEGDARKFRFPDEGFHGALLMGNSFGYFEHEDDDAQVLAAVKNALVSKGTIVLDLVDGGWMAEHFQPRSWEWIDQDYFVCRERSLAKDGRRLITREVVVHAEKGVVADQFYAERLYTRDGIQELLTQVGFEQVRFGDPMKAESTRGQDLGMMEHRFLVIATAPRKAAKAAPKGPLFPQVTVVMGDATLPDMVKKGGKFNEEDFETINRLKHALAELPGYRFQFLDRHDTLVHDLRHAPPHFVLNLCDEGYMNDAFMELHVPATLEMMGIPYTGGGPACLALCYNKSHVAAIAQSIDVPVPMETYFDPNDSAAHLPSVFPALVKPNTGDSSLGITKDAVVRSMDEFMAYLEKLRHELAGRALLVQEYLEGGEYSVGLIGNPGQRFIALPVLEVDYSKLPEGLTPILSYESKWLPDSPYWTDISYKQAVLDEDTQRKLVDYSMLLFERLGCRDYARFDFRADSQGTVKLLEVNPNPGWCWDGKLNLMAGFAGMRYADLLGAILESAQERVALDLNLKHGRIAAKAAAEA
ncbi:MAG: methyltransferase domain-containing protein [Deltaproteobacteria bacterium]|nr:methyltransferase domain-containing protein [Deltaproteobacteria bacterium]MCB9489808.1 methyltransferase domain-containing protein [Deltaproteobacteria bacterium]